MAGIHGFGDRRGLGCGRLIHPSVATRFYPFSTGGARRTATTMAAISGEAVAITATIPIRLL